VIRVQFTLIRGLICGFEYIICSFNEARVDDLFFSLNSFVLHS